MLRVPCRLATVKHRLIHVGALPSCPHLASLPLADSPRRESGTADYLSDDDHEQLQPALAIDDQNVTLLTAVFASRDARLGSGISRCLATRQNGSITSAAPRGEHAGAR